jgi:general secretion pathway protein I
MRSQSGFTLLEIMAALAILAVALVALLVLRNRDLALQGHARHLVTATSLAKLKLEELSHKVPSDGQTGSSEFGERFPGFGWESRTTPAPLPGWLELWVEVHWQEGARKERVSLTTYVPEQL